MRLLQEEYDHLVSHGGRPLDGVRVAIICADRNAHAGLAKEIENVGGVPLPRALLGDVAGVAGTCAIVVVFIDSYEPDAIRPRLDGIERWKDGPTLVVVTDRERPWIPSLERDRPAIVVASSEWALKVAALQAPPTEPELPVTD